MMNLNCYGFSHGFLFTLPMGLNVATLPEVRRQGIGRALTVAPLLESRAWGYRIGTLQSTPMGLNLYRRLRFREYCTFHAYFWSGE